MSESEAQSAADVADHRGYRSLPRHRGILFRTYAQTFQSGLSISVEYRGTDAELIAAGIVTGESLVPRPGHPRRDSAGRRVKLERRLDGIRVVTFYGDPFATPRLPAISQQLVNEAIEERKRIDREYEESHRKWQASTPDEPITPETHLQAATVPIRNLVVISGDFSLQLRDQVWDHLAQIEKLIAAESKRLAQAGANRPKSSGRPRPEFLRLVVDNTVQS